MEVPCPVPLLQPWSPVGYQVVQIAEPVPPGAPPPPPQPWKDRPRPVASSPVGYKVTMVASETVPVPPSYMSVARRTKKAPPRTNPYVVGGVIVSVGLVLLTPILALALMVASRPAAPPMAQFQVVIPEEIQAVDLGAVAAQPPAEKPAPVQEKPQAAPVVQAKDACPQCDALEDKALADLAKPPAREKFQTEVEFVRNAQEAARIAKADNKLTFLLHVSGNFEDPGFT